MALARAQRIPVQCEVEFTHEDGVTGQGTVFNLSAGGCAVQSDTSVADNMLVTLRLASSQGGAPIVIELGRVRWATRREFGVEFVMVLSKEQARLDHFLITAASAPGSSGAQSAAAA